MALENIKNSTEILESGKPRPFIGSRIMEAVSDVEERKEFGPNDVKNRTLKEKVSLLENSYTVGLLSCCGPSLND